MQGARDLHKLISSIGNSTTNPCELKFIKNIGGYASSTYQHKNIVFLLGEHARGYTLRIWIYKDSDIQDCLKEQHIEVYGITGGQNGWTETYGWVEKGNWVDYLEKYFNSLREYSAECQKKRAVRDAESAEQERLQKKKLIEEFNCLFPDDGTTK